MEKYINQIVAIDTILSNPPDAHYPVWFAEQIENLPAADVIEVVHGRWVKNEEESQNHIESIYFCSACQNWEAWGETEKYKYCPNCGAKMDGGK
jgi:rubrerythrin